jgi:hypothetical protein
MKTTMTIAFALALASSPGIADDMAKKAPDAKKPPDAKKVEAPKPPAEIAELLKMGGGTWKCTGKGMMDPANAANLTDMKGGFTAKADLDKFFIKVEWNVTTPMKMNGLIYVTYDAAGKKWHRVMVDSVGAISKESSAGAKDGKLVWEGEGTAMGITTKMRTTEEWKAKEVKMTSEVSMDGKKWITGFEQTCKK